MSTILFEVCEECNEVIKGEACQSCCTHDFDYDEGGECMNGCGTNGYEHCADSYPEDK